MDEALIGQSLPKLSLANTEGGPSQLPDYFLGHWTVLYFYPKDDTPGCTKQACSYGENIDAFTRLGALVVGVSADDLSSHAAFQTKYDFEFPLLADTDNLLSRNLGVYREQNGGDRSFQGISRDTFIIDHEGLIRHVWRNVDPTTTMGETHEKLVELMG